MKFFWLTNNISYTTSIKYYYTIYFCFNYPICRWNIFFCTILCSIIYGLSVCVMCVCVCVCVCVWGFFLGGGGGTYHISGTILRKKKLDMKYVFWFSLHLFSEAVSFLGRIQQDIIINIHSMSCKMPDILVRFQPNYNCISSPQYKFIQNPSSGNQVVPCRRADGQMDRYDEANGH